MGKIKGGEFVFYINDVSSLAIAYSTDWDYTLTKNFVETTTFADGDWNSYLPCGGRELNGNINEMLLKEVDSSYGYDFFVDSWFNDTSIKVKYTPTNGDASTKYLVGSVFVGDIKINNPGTKGFVTYAIPVKSSGTFTWDACTA